jgi:hypothetical protein
MHDELLLLMMFDTVASSSGEANYVRWMDHERGAGWHGACALLKNLRLFSACVNYTEAQPAECLKIANFIMRSCRHRSFLLVADGVISVQYHINEWPSQKIELNRLIN